MAKSKVKVNYLDDNIYTNRKVLYFKLFFLSFFFFVIGLALHFPLTKTIVKVVEKSLTINSACKIKHSKINLSYFFPTLTIHNPSLPSRCLTHIPITKNYSIDFKKMDISFHSLSFSPLGIRTKVTLLSQKSALKLYPIIGLGKVSITIKNTSINGILINKLIGKENLLSGKIKINGIINSDLVYLENFKLHIKSTNLRINNANISGFELGAMQVNNLSLKASLKKKSKLKVIELLIGDKKSPVIANAKGLITLNQRNINTSKLNLKSELKLSKAFISDYPFVNLLLKGPKTKTGFYNLKIKGNLGAPSVSFQ